MFIDLGHGTGKGVLIGSMVHQFDKCSGIELLESLHTESTKLKEKYDQYIDEVNELEYQRIFWIPHCNAPKFELIHGRLDTQHQEFMETNEKSRAQEKMMLELQGERKEMLEEFKVIKQ